MSRRPRCNHSPAFKAKVALAAVKGEKTLAEMAHSLTFTRTKSRRGALSCWKGPQACSAATLPQRVLSPPLMSKRYMPGSAN